MCHIYITNDLLLSFISNLEDDQGKLRSPNCHVSFHTKLSLAFLFLQNGVGHGCCVYLLIWIELEFSLKNHCHCWFALVDQTFTYFISLGKVKARLVYWETNTVYHFFELFKHLNLILLFLIMLAREYESFKNVDALFSRRDNKGLRVSWPIHWDNLHDTPNYLWFIWRIRYGS